MKKIVAIIMVLMSFFVPVELDAMTEGSFLFTTPEKKPRAQLFFISPQEKNRDPEEDSIKKNSGRCLWDKEYDSSEGEEFEDDGKEDTYSDCRKSPASNDNQVDDDNEGFCCSLCQGYIEIILDCGHSYCGNCASFSAEECPACFDSMS